MTHDADLFIGVSGSPGVCDKCGRFIARNLDEASKFWCPVRDQLAEDDCIRHSKIRPNAGAVAAMAEEIDTLKAQCASLRQALRVASGITDARVSGGPHGTTKYWTLGWWSALGGDVLYALTTAWLIGFMWRGFTSIYGAPVPFEYFFGLTPETSLPVAVLAVVITIFRRWK